MIDCEIVDAQLRSTQYAVLICLSRKERHALYPLLENAGYIFKSVVHHDFVSTDVQAPLYKCGHCGRLTEDNFQRQPELHGYDSDSEYVKCSKCNVKTQKHDREDCLMCETPLDGCYCAELDVTRFCDCRCSKLQKPQPLKNAIMVTRTKLGARDGGKFQDCTLHFY